MGDILFLAHRFPYPPDRGDKIRSWHILKALSKIAPVHLCCLIDDPRDFQHLSLVGNVCASINFERRNSSKLRAALSSVISGQPASVEAFASPGLGRKIDNVLANNDVDTIFAFSGQMAQFVPENISGRRFIMDFVDVDSAKFLGYAAQSFGLRSLANWIEGKRLAAFERKTALRADLSLFVSRDEADLFSTLTGFDDHKVQALENGIDLQAFDPDQNFPAVGAAEGPLIVFTGQMDYPPNGEAVTAFATQTLPKIRKAMPHATFAIVGRAPTAAVRALARLDAVLVTGEVSDTRDWLSAADIVVAPLRLARGVQNKVLEAMAMAKPVVASSAAAAGLDVTAGDDLVVADGPDAESVAIIALLDDPVFRNRLGHAARARMVSGHSWEARLAPLRNIVRPGVSST